eukprot:37357-Eustigmatos_ZCMA.PRE.1
MWLWVMLWSPASFAGALYTNQTVPIVAIDCAVAVTSIVYWWNPIRGWRRDLDMTMVVLAMLLHYVL